jgi:hypothetical protein
MSEQKLTCPWCQRTNAEGALCIIGYATIQISNGDYREDIWECKHCKTTGFARTFGGDVSPELRALV